MMGFMALVTKETGFCGGPGHETSAQARSPTSRCATSSTRTCRSRRRRPRPRLSCRVELLRVILTRFWLRWREGSMGRRLHVIVGVGTPGACTEQLLRPRSTSAARTPATGAERRLFCVRDHRGDCDQPRPSASVSQNAISYACRARAARTASCGSSPAASPAATTDFACSAKPGAGSAKNRKNPTARSARP
jgi:hypothetical protein